MRTTGMATEYYPFPPLQQVKVSIRNVESITYSEEFCSWINRNKQFKRIKHVLCLTIQFKRLATWKGSSLQPFESRKRGEVALPACSNQFNKKYSLSYVHCALWHLGLACAGITLLVTSNPLCHCTFSLICHVEVIFKLSCSTDTGCMFFCCRVFIICHDTRTRRHIIHPVPVFHTCQYLIVNSSRTCQHDTLGAHLNYTGSLCKYLLPLTQKRSSVDIIYLIDIMHII
jgi:hypothetical protein